MSTPSLKNVSYNIKKNIIKTILARINQLKIYYKNIKNYKNSFQVK